MKNKKGFTLIELLTIIIILAIIAVITVPIILNIIDNSKKGAVMDSAHGYILSIKHFYYGNQTIDSEFEFDEKVYTVPELRSLGLSVNGKEPGGNSWVEMSDIGDVARGCLQYDSYKVIINEDDVGSVEKGRCSSPWFNGIYVEATNADTHKGIVYLDPTDLSNTCDAIIAATNIDSETGDVVGIKSGCMKWYIFDENADGTVDMILDHNTSLGIDWTYYYEGGATNVRNFYGPRESLYQLYEDTKDWNGIEPLTSSSNYSVSWTFNDDNHIYTIDYTKNLSSAYSYDYSSNPSAYRARFITAEEVAQIIGLNSFGLSRMEYYYFRGYSWLFENLNNCELYGCYKQSGSELIGNYGYWTSSVVIDSSMDAWAVVNDSRINSYMSHDIWGYNRINVGIRPVITVSKDILGIE